LLSLLQARRDWPARVLAQRLEVSERTVRRDIDRLRALDYAIDATRGPDGGYRLEAGAHLPPLLFDDGQTIAIALALRTAASLGAGIEEDAQRALATLQRLLPSHLAHRIDNLIVATSQDRHPTQPEADPAVLLRIGDAIRTNHELRFDYAAPAHDASTAPSGANSRPRRSRYARWIIQVSEHGLPPGERAMRWRAGPGLATKERRHISRSIQPMIRLSFS